MDRGFQAIRVEPLPICSQKVFVRKLSSAVSRIFTGQDEQPTSGRRNMVGIADPGDRKDIAACAILPDVHSREQLRIDAENDMRRQRLSGPDTSRKAILAVLEQ